MQAAFMQTTDGLAGYSVCDVPADTPPRDAMAVVHALAEWGLMHTSEWTNNERVLLELIRDYSKRLANPDA